jgi:hypothetical protein
MALVPLAFSVFWGPMAIAIMGGLVSATVLTLFFVPALYAAWTRVPRAHEHIERKGWLPLPWPAPRLPAGQVPYLPTHARK